MNWSITQLDVKNTFFHGYLHEKVFIIQHLEFENVSRPSHVCSLEKALYCLKQALSVWFDRFSHYLLEFSFKCSKADPSLFTYHHNGDTTIWFLYVDDIILTCSSFVLFKTIIIERIIILQWNIWEIFITFWEFKFSLNLVDYFLVRQSILKIFYTMRTCRDVMWFILHYHYDMCVQRQDTVQWAKLLSKLSRQTTILHHYATIYTIHS